MTDDNNTGTAAEDAAVNGPEIDAAASETDHAPETTDAPNAEAKSWRLKYRAADTRAQVAEARVAEQNRRQAERILATRLADPSDAFANGLDINTVLDEHGIVDEQAVREYADDLVARKPHYAAKLRPAGAPASAVKSADPIPTPGSTPSWQDVFGGRAR